METGIRIFSGIATDCKRNWHPHLQGWGGTENRKCDYESVHGKEVRFISYNNPTISYKTVGLLLIMPESFVTLLSSNEY